LNFKQKKPDDYENLQQNYSKLESDLKNLNAENQILKDKNTKLTDSLNEHQLKNEIVKLKKENEAGTSPDYFQSQISYPQGELNKIQLQNLKDKPELLKKRISELEDKLILVIRENLVMKRKLKLPLNFDGMDIASLEDSSHQQQNLFVDFQQIIQHSIPKHDIRILQPVAIVPSEVYDVMMKNRNDPTNLTVRWKHFK
jgi:regulator of replication initiation timing